MNKIKTIYFDLDGVLADFVHGVCDIFWIDYKNLLLKWTSEYPDVYKMEEVLGITTEEFWNAIAKAGMEFWSGLRPIQENVDLFLELRKNEKIRTCILTSPAWSGNSAVGKMAWMQRHFNDDRFQDYILTPSKNKHLLAKPGTLLIDDSRDNYEKFVKSGGEAILYPCMWNVNVQVDLQKLSEIRNSSIAYLKRLVSWSCEN